MKKLLALLLVLAMAVTLVACGGTKAPAADAPAAEAPAAEAPAETVSLTLWGAEEDQALLTELVEKFKATYPDQTFDIQIGVESESTAKDTILTDIEAAADVFAFANDQLADLVKAGALLEISGDVSAVLPNFTGKTLDEVLAANGPTSVEACTKDGKVYALPMVGGNNYFLYYDSTRVTPEQAQSWDGLLAAAEAAGSKVGMTFASGWYNASFFLGAGFTTGLNADGTTTIDWNGTSADGYTGVQVAQAMAALTSNPNFVNVTEGDSGNQVASGAVCAIVSGSWDAQTCQETFGEGYAATKLPTFTIGEDQVQMGCYSGFKLMGVNAYSKNSGWALLLAEFLCNEESQAARFDARQLSPTNLVVAADEAVTSNLAVAASNAQDAFGVIQNVGGKYWDPTATFGQMIANGELPADEAGIQAALDTLVESVTAAVE